MLGATTQFVSVFGAPAVILLYIAYELRFGRVAEFQTTLTALSGTILALSKHVEGVDAAKVADSLPDRVVTTHDFYTDDNFEQEVAANGDEALEDLIDRVDEYMEEERQAPSQEDTEDET